MEEDLGRVQGWAGWSPVPAIADRGDDKVMVIADFVGGEDNKPTSEIGKYVGVDGLVADIEDAVALPKGATGEKPKMNSTSITSNVIGTGAKTFTLATPLDMVVGEVVKAYSLADPNNYVCGYITNISPTSIEINVSEIGGTGTKTDWVIVSSAFQGKQGITTTNMVTANRLLGKGAGQAVPSSPAELEPFGVNVASNRFHVGVEQTSNPAITIDNPPSGIFTSVGGTPTGAIRIKLPATTEAIFYKIYISIWEYSTNRPSNLVISCYPNDFVGGYDAVLYGSILARKVTVRGYNDSGTKYIYIADTNTVWGYCKAVIQRVEGYFSGATFDLVAKNWEITLQTAFTGSLVWTVADPRPQFNPNQILSEYNAASGVNTQLTNLMSEIQMFQNLDKRMDDRYTKAESNGRFPTLPPVGPTLSSILVGDVRGTNPIPGTDRQRGVWFEFKNSADMGLVSGNTYSAVTTFIPWTDDSGNNSSAHRVASSAGNLWFQNYASAAWGTWYRLLDNRGSASNLILGNGTYKAVSDFALKVDGAMYRVNNAIAGGVDLNTLIATGFYVQQSNGSATLVLNYPATRAGFLIVYANTSSYIFQNYIDYATGETWTRSNGGGGSWSAWKKTVVLGADGKIDKTLLPALAITDTFPVASQAAMLALTAEVGDVAVRSDISKTFILRAEPATTLSNWTELLNPTDAVTSVAGKTGVVNLVKADVGLSNVDNTPDTAKPVSTAQQTAIDAKVADNLTASTTVAPSKTAVNTALALKADIAATTGTLVALTFTSDSVQGTIASPLTGNITGNITGAKLGVVTLVIHNHTTAPTFDSKYKKLSGSGSYVTGSINYIFCEYINDTEIIYSINQRT